MQAPLFSIVIPTYNRAQQLQVAIKSVLTQTCKEWELIIVDDGSTDNTREVVDMFDDERILYFHQQNKERSAARNNGIANGNGQYVCFLDSDDEYFPNHLSELKSAIEERNSPVSMFYTGAVTQTGTTRKEHPVYDTAKWSHPVRFVFFGFPLTNSVCVHRELLSINRFNEQMNVLEDIHLWIRVVKEAPLYQVHKYTTVAHIPEGGEHDLFTKGMWEELCIYLSNIEDLFLNHGLYRFITGNERVQFYTKRYVMWAFGRVWVNQPGMAFKAILHCFGLSFWFMMDKRFWKLLREIAVYMIKR